MSWYCPLWPHISNNFVFIPHMTQSRGKRPYDILYSEPTYNPLPFSFFSLSDVGLQDSFSFCSFTIHPLIGTREDAYKAHTF